MTHRLIAAALAAACATVSPAALAQVPTDQLLKPPADARKFVIISAAGQHGTAFHWKTADGSEAIRESILLRGFVFEQDQVTRFGPNGQPDRIEVRGVVPSGDAAELFEVKGGTASWKSPIDQGSKPYDGKGFYLTQGGPWSGAATMAEKLHAMPDKKLSLLPGGEARLVKLTETEVGGRTITAWAVEGLSLTPLPIWMDGGRFWGFTSGMGILPEAHKGEFSRLQKLQVDALAARGPAIAQRFDKVAPTPVAFTNVKLFDADKGVFVAGQTVVADKGRIVMVAPSATARPPAGAKIIDGTGKTLVPGIWDAHIHVGDEAQGVMLYAIGVTSGRDPGGDVEKTAFRKARMARGELLFPTIYSSVLIDGKGPLAAQGGVSVGSAEEAVAGVRMAKDKGFTGVKFYTSMKPEWLKAGVEEAKKLGLHVHGHIPATMRPAQAIAMGYDEITHINFVMMQAMPDEVVNVSNGLARFQGPGRYAKDVDLAAEPMKSLIATMAAKKIVSDPTVAVFETLYTQENGELSPSYAPYLGTMPPATERSFRAGGDAPPEGVTRADYKASYAKLLALTAALHKAGVPIVAGTDGNGLEIHRELELYVKSGFTPAEAIQAATIVPARLVGADETSGSIVVGKEADMVLVDGDAATDLGALRRTIWVMSDGKLMNADELRQVAGFSGRPK